MVGAGTGKDTFVNSHSTVPWIPVHFTVRKRDLNNINSIKLHFWFEGKIPYLSNRRAQTQPFVEFANLSHFPGLEPLG